jgi:hypothetical protein
MRQRWDDHEVYEVLASSVDHRRPSLLKSLWLNYSSQNPSPAGLSVDRFRDE